MPLINESWHSIHSGQTIDNMVSNFETLQSNLSNVSGRLESLSTRMDGVETSLDNKYNITGGIISGGVHIAGRSSVEDSKLQVKYIDGAPGSVNATDCPLYLNTLQPGGAIYFGRSISDGKHVAQITSSGKIFGAVWNDFAEYRKSDEQEPGRVICECGDGSLALSQKRLQAGANIISDTFGFAIGETEECQTPVAVAGRVLAYPYEDWWTFEPGEPVCTGPNGTISKMTRREVRKYPDRIIGTVSELPTYENWGQNQIKVNGRIWIKVK